jgi:hypothetical protein
MVMSSRCWIIWTVSNSSSKEARGEPSATQTRDSREAGSPPCGRSPWHLLDEVFIPASMRSLQDHRQREPTGNVQNCNAFCAEKAWIPRRLRGRKGSAFSSSTAPRVHRAQVGATSPEMRRARFPGAQVLSLRRHVSALTWRMRGSWPYGNTVDPDLSVHPCRQANDSCGTV